MNALESLRKSVFEKWGDEIYQIAAEDGFDDSFIEGDFDEEEIEFALIEWLDFITGALAANDYEKAYSLLIEMGNSEEEAKDLLS